jgi:flavin reductase (DIM6/NTAB) family NADH-FMN oxidoreductase RutF
MREVGPERFRSVMGHFATGVTVVTAASTGGPVGMTANAVTSLSLEPLLLLVAFDNEARTLPAVQEIGRFGVNVLAAGQADLARLFASKAPEREKFAGVAHTVHGGIPVIEGVLAWVGCRLERLVEDRDAVVHAVGHAGELLLLRQLGGEEPRQVLLAGREHVDAEAPGLAHHRQRARAVVEAHEQQHRVQRQRADRVRGHPDRAHRRRRGHDRDAGGEVAHHGAEAVGRDLPHRSTSVPYMPSSSWLATVQTIR